MTIANDLSLVIGQRAEKVDRPVVTVSSETWLVDAARRGRTPTASNCSIGYVEGSPGRGRLLAAGSPLAVKGEGIGKLNEQSMSILLSSLSSLHTTHRTLGRDNSLRFLYTGTCGPTTLDDNRSNSRLLVLTPAPADAFLA